MDDLTKFAREPRRLTVIVLGCATITLGNALALWASVVAFGGGATIVAVTIAPWPAERLPRRPQRPPVVALLRRRR